MPKKQQIVELSPTQDLKGVLKAFKFAKARSFEIIEGREDFESICERVTEVYDKFYGLAVLEDCSNAMHSWWMYLNKHCRSKGPCIECRKGSLAMRAEYEEEMAEEAARAEYEQLVDEEAERVRCKQSQ